MSTQRAHPALGAWPSRVQASAAYGDGVAYLGLELYAHWRWHRMCCIAVPIKRWPRRETRLKSRMWTLGDFWRTQRHSAQLQAHIILPRVSGAVHSIGALM
jgi:hypothetical protein